jgi:chemotaxis protein CheY-P-specific phosphatase CheC
MSQAGIVEQTVNKIFEDMYFMFPEHIMKPETHFSIPIQCYVAKTQLKREKSAIFIYAEDHLVNQMAMNFLGEKRNFGHIELLDIFKEAANVIAGNYLTASNKPPEVSFDIPVVNKTSIVSWDKDHSCQIDLIYDIEKYFFRIALVV